MLFRSLPHERGESKDVVEDSKKLGSEEQWEMSARKKMTWWQRKRRVWGETCPAPLLIANGAHPTATAWDAELQHHASTIWHNRHYAIYSTHAQFKEEG